MRPVNLIPPEDRRGEHAPLRTGVTAYVLIGALAIALLTVTALVLTGNSIHDRESELAALEARQTTATQTAEALTPYVEFASMSAAREETVSSLAESRFDWERVLRELSLVIPDDVWLINATGTGAPGASTGSAAAANTLREGTTGPALELIGCARSQRAVAGFVAALEDIDGVTRVGVSSSELGQSSNGAATGASGATSDCRTRSFISRFEIVAAFDEAPAAGAAVIPDPGTAPTSPDPAADPETADAVAQEQQAADSTAEQTGEAGDAANLVGATP